jgi:hypothetical protein
LWKLVYRVYFKSVFDRWNYKWNVNTHFVKPGRWHWGRNAGWGCLRIGCWGEYLDLRETKWQGNEESCITRSWMICTPYPILCGW